MDALELMGQIDQGCRILDRIGRELSDALQAFAITEREYTTAVEQEKLRIFHGHREKGERLPAEDLRDALAHQQIDSALYGRWLNGRAEINALRAHARAVEHSLSGRQSLLAAMKAEMAAIR